MFERLFDKPIANYIKELKNQHLAIQNRIIIAEILQNKYKDIKCSPELEIVFSFTDKSLIKHINHFKITESQRGLLNEKVYLELFIQDNDTNIEILYGIDKFSICEIELIFDIQKQTYESKLSKINPIKDFFKENPINKNLKNDIFLSIAKLFSRYKTKNGVKIPQVYKKLLLLA